RDSTDSKKIVGFSYGLGDGAVYWSSLPLGRLIGQFGPLGATIQTVYVPNLLDHIISLQSHGSPVVLEPPSSIGALAGGSIELSVAAVGEAPLQYEWFREGEAITGAE